MLTNLQLKTIIQNNLNDPRVYSIQAFLTDLITRKTTNPNMPINRIRDTITNTLIPDLATFIANIDDVSMVANYYFTQNLTNENICPTIVTINNYIIEFVPNSEEDSMYTAMYGNNNKIAFILGYLNDSDAALPLKILNIKLVK